MDELSQAKAVRLLIVLAMISVLAASASRASESQSSGAELSTLVVTATDFDSEPQALASDDVKQPGSPGKPDASAFGSGFVTKPRSGSPSQLVVRASDEAGSIGDATPRQSPGLKSVNKPQPLALPEGKTRAITPSTLRRLATSKLQQPVALLPSKPKADLTVVSNSYHTEPLQAVRYSQWKDLLYTATHALAIEPVKHPSQTKSPKKSLQTLSLAHQSKSRSRGQLQMRSPRLATRQQPPSRRLVVEKLQSKVPRATKAAQKTIVRQANAQLQAAKEMEWNPAADALIEAHEISLVAKSEAEFSQVVQLCVQGLREGAKGESRDFAQQMSAWALNRRGQLRAETNQNSLAMADFRAALDYDPNHWRALHNRGVTKAQSGQFAEAFDDFSRVIQLNPKFAKSFSNRATLYVQAGDLQSALDEYDRALQLDDTLVAAHMGRGRVCHLLGRLEEAMVHYDSAVQLNTVSAQIVCSRADLLADMGRYAAAMADYARAIDLQPDFAHAYRNGAWLLATCPDADLRDAENALVGAQRAVEYAYGERYAALDTLAAAQANAGEFPTAIATVQQAIDIAPEEARQAYKVRLQLYEQRLPFRTKPLDE